MATVASVCWPVWVGAISKLASCQSTSKVSSQGLRILSFKFIFDDFAKDNRLKKATVDKLVQEDYDDEATLRELRHSNPREAALKLTGGTISAFAIGFGKVFPIQRRGGLN